MSDRDNYRGDVWYEEYRRGLPEGSLSDDRIDDGFERGISPEGLVSAECQRRADARASQEEEDLARQQYEEYEMYEAYRQEPDDA